MVLQAGYTDVVGQLAQQPFPKLASAPSGLLSPHGDNHCFDLGGKLIGVAVGGSRPVRQSFSPHSSYRS